MKKITFRWPLIFVMAAMCVGFTSCGDDEESVTPTGDRNAETKQPTPLVFGASNKHLTAIGYYPAGMNWCHTYSYNAEGVDEIVDNYSSYTFQFIEQQKKLNAVHKSRSSRSFTAKLTYNSMGYVSTLRSALSSDTYDADADCPDLDFKYDVEGRLLEVYEKRHLSDSNDYLWKFSWVNDTITTIRQTNLSTGRDNFAAHFAYGGGKHLNKYRQYTYSLVPSIGDVGEIGSLFFVGYVGKGPAYFPAREVMSDRTTTLSYVINNDGAVETETIDHGTSSNNANYHYE